MEGHVGSALLKKQNVNWGYQFYRAATSSFTSQKQRDPRIEHACKTDPPLRTPLPLTRVDNSKREDYYKFSSFKLQRIERKKEQSR
jgi:hypothetical protein